MKFFALVRVGGTLKFTLKKLARVSEYQVTVKVYPPSHSYLFPHETMQNSTWTKMAEASSSSFDWNLLVSVLNLEDKPLYFCSETVPNRYSSIHSTEGDLLARFPRGTCFALTAHNPGDSQQSSVRNALAHAALERDLVSCKPSNARVLSSFAFFPGTRGRFQRSLFISSPQHQTGATEQVVAEMARKYGQPAFYRYVWKAETIVQELVATVSCQLVSSFPIAPAPFPIVAIAPAPYPPVFADASSHSVFHGVKKIKEVLLELQASTAMHLCVCVCVCLCVCMCVCVWSCTPVVDLCSVPIWPHSPWSPIAPTPLSPPPPPPDHTFTL